MTRTTLGTLAVLVAAAFAAVSAGGVVGMGIIAGVLCGTSVAALGAAWQRHVFRTRPKQAMASVVQTFLFKLAFVTIGAVSFRYVEAAAVRVDWKSFLVAFVVSVFIVQTLAVLDNVRLLTGGKDSLPADPPLTESPSSRS
jgi:hypothetical protein